MSDISIHEEGHGNAILLVHGFPMSSAIWDKFARRLTLSFRVLTLDLPGFGDSSLLPTPFTLEDVAAAVLEKLEASGVRKMVAVGHSLGGYVTLAMVAKNPELFAGFALLHSTAKADSEDKKESRNKTIEFINKNGASAFTGNFITPLFADSNHPDVPFVREMNIRAEAPALTGYTAAMRDRPDRTALLADFPRPVLLIAGAKDPGIPVEDMRAQAALTQKGSLHVLEDQAHMSLIEDVPTSSSLVYDFALRCYG